ncbi:acyl carrier protein [Streptomyces sp. NPDC048639]|uniref:acyl carrier protein n=1 Tax=Streptomyces sp. NPDC048639 TaxID=3365581 RepID=UPI0037232E13
MEQPVQEFDTEALTSLLQEYFNLPAGESPSTATIEHLGLDSLALMELTVVLEDRTGIDLSDRLGQLSPSDTLEQVARTIRNAVAE